MTVYLKTQTKKQKKIIDEKNAPSNGFITFYIF